jgi:hypothetical protein
VTVVQSCTARPLVIDLFPTVSQASVACDSAHYSSIVGLDLAALIHYHQSNYFDCALSLSQKEFSSTLPCISPIASSYLLSPLHRAVPAQTLRPTRVHIMNKYCFCTVRLLIVLSVAARKCVHCFGYLYPFLTKDDWKQCEHASPEVGSRNISQ